MPNYKILVEYDGTGLAGWQWQPDCPSVQAYLERALQKLTGEEAKIFCAGRTDAGVHALGQVGNFVLENPMPVRNIRDGLNFHLETPQISVLNAEEADDRFHARFCAKGRRYRYHIINRPSPLAIMASRAWLIKRELNVKAMQEAAQYLLGKHDFTSFRDTQCQAKSPIKTLDRLEVSAEGENIYIDVEAPSFLHHMVRNLTGTLTLVGKGKWKPEQVKDALEAKNRSAAGPTAPAYGLYFIGVDYD